ncbi:efflux transporter outer membrane subunit [Synoicihabitans lomoniglobus]|uniref:Efflux transporter outer membrane subunit n=1 Tax=Synoicihabitans lomoniglobus TaxID=2909285 RepID=A0AAE9ZSD7_9BACT|nr:efflux transporter outer membrane subunit [Opitutaceae bacterium LMO-M01]WED63312.1 efflux transporter outer membrane subunit [Opitutaceae bacterium LMO-M01]
MLKSITPFLATALLTGCSLAPRYEQPIAPVAATYPTGSDRVDGPSIDTLTWSEFFGDARLRAVIQLALDHNTDLQVAALRVERVRALYNIQRTALIPTLNATGDAVRQRTPGDLNSTGAPVTTSSYQVGLEIPSYELDFFGRVASLRDQVLQQYLASEEAARSARISLVSAVARQYLAALALDEQFALARQTFASADRAYDLNRQSFEAGVASELDLATAEAQREAVRATLAAIEAQRDQAHNALTLLVGTTLPTDLPPGGSLATQNLIADLPVGLPADLLTHRPDILAAEHVLQAANANIGVARAAFFPSIKLTASGGTASADLSGLFESGSGAWRFAPSITVPIFAAGANKARLEVAEIETRIEVANYQRAIQTAFREVADTLAVRRSIAVQIAAQSARVAAAQRRFDLSTQRFDAGVDSYLTVLLAQQELFGAQQALIQARLTESTNLTALYAALGGG